MRFNKFYILPTFFILVSSGSCGDDSAVAGLKNELNFQTDLSSRAVDILYDTFVQSAQNMPSEDYKILLEENKSLKQQMSSFEKEKIKLCTKIKEAKNSEDRLKEEITSKEKDILDLINDKNKIQDQLECIIQAINNTEIPKYCIEEILNKDQAIDQIEKIGVKFKQEIEEKNKATEMLQKSSSQLKKDLLECESKLQAIIAETIKELNSLNFKSRPVDKNNIVSIIHDIYTNQKKLIKTNNEQKFLIDNIRLETKNHQNNIQCEKCKNIDLDKDLLKGIKLLYEEHNNLGTEVKKAIGKIDSNCQNNNLKKCSISEKFDNLINYYNNLLNKNQNNKGVQDKKIKSLTDENNKLKNKNSQLEILLTTSVNQLNQLSKNNSLDITPAVDLQFVGGDNPIIKNFDNLFGNGGLLQTDIKNLRDSLIELNNSNLKTNKTYNCQLFKEVEDKYLELLNSINKNVGNNQVLLSQNEKIQNELNNEKMKLQNLLEKINNSKLSIVYPVNNVNDDYDKISKILDSVVQDSSSIDKVNALLFDKNPLQNKGELFLGKVYKVIKYYKDKVQNLENIQNRNNSDKDNQVVSLNKNIDELNSKLTEYDKKFATIKNAINNSDNVINNLSLNKANDSDTTVQLVKEVCDKYNKDLLFLRNFIVNKKIDGNNFEVKVFNEVMGYIKDLYKQIDANSNSNVNKLNLKDKEIVSLNNQVDNLKKLLNFLIGKINNSVLAQDKMGYNKHVELDLTNNSCTIKNLDILSNVETDIKAILPKLNAVSNFSNNVVSKGIFCRLIEDFIIIHNDLKNKYQKLQNDKNFSDDAKIKIEQELNATKKNLESLTNSIKDSGLISPNLIRGNTSSKIAESIESIFSNKNEDNVKKEKDSLQEIINVSKNAKNITSDVIPIFKQAGDKIFELQKQLDNLTNQNNLLKNEKDELNDKNNNKQKQIDDLKNDKDKGVIAYTKLEKNMKDLVVDVNNVLGKNGLGYSLSLGYDNNNQVVQNLGILKDKGTVVTELNNISEEITKLNLKKKQLPVKPCKGSLAQQIIDLIQAYKDIQEDLIGEDSNNKPMPGAYEEMSKKLLYVLLRDTIYLAKRLAYLAGGNISLSGGNARGVTYSTSAFYLTWYKEGAYKCSDASGKLSELDKILQASTYIDNGRFKYQEIR